MLGTKILEERKSKYNGELKVVRTIGYGTYIQAEGLTQSGGIVETIWKSTLKKVHRSLPTVHRSLILGLGGGTVAKLIRKNWTDAKITGIDIDPHMIELGQKYLGLDKTNIEIKIADALDFLTVHRSRSTVHFDLIIVDLYNGDKYPEKFELETYMNLVKKNLKVGGVAIFNRLYYGEKRPRAVKFGNKLMKTFPKVDWFYPEANLTFLCYNI